MDIDGGRARARRWASPTAWALLWATVLPMLLAACGPEVVGAAAGTAAAEAASAQRAQEEKARALEQARVIEKLQQDRVQDIDKQVDRQP